MAGCTSGPLFLFFLFFSRTVSVLVISHSLASLSPSPDLSLSLPYRPSLSASLTTTGAASFPRSLPCSAAVLLSPIAVLPLFLLPFCSSPSAVGCLSLSFRRGLLLSAAGFFLLRRDSFTMAVGDLVLALLTHNSW